MIVFKEAPNKELINTTSCSRFQTRLLMHYLSHFKAANFTAVSHLFKTHLKKEMTLMEIKEHVEIPFIVVWAVDTHTHTDRTHIPVSRYF